MTHKPKVTSIMAVGLLGLSLALSACGREGPLEKAPPIFDKDGKPVARETEKAKPTAKQKNAMPDPYTRNVSVRDAPIEGTGNAQKH